MLEPLHFTLVKWGYQAGAEPAAKGTGSLSRNPFPRDRPDGPGGEQTIGLSP